MANSTDHYVPGVCNIGRAEVRMRKAVGWIGLAAAVGLWGMFIYMKASPLARLWVAGPALASAIGFLQAARGFCVNFGLAGAFNFGPKLGATDTVEQAEFRRQDRRTAIVIIAQAVVIAVLAGVAAYLAPL
jgi:hypothetical protein